LAIDIQGLSEVQTNKRKEYLADIFAEIDKAGYVEELEKGWVELKKTFDEKKLKVKPFIDVINSQNLKKLFTENMDNPNILPNWLQEVVRVLDEKIDANKQNS